MPFPEIRVDSENGAQKYAAVFETKDAADEAARADGWRVTDSEHLCADCLE